MPANLMVPDQSTGSRSNDYVEAISRREHSHQSSATGHGQRTFGQPISFHSNLGGGVANLRKIGGVEALKRGAADFCHQLLRAGRGQDWPLDQLEFLRLNSPVKCHSPLDDMCEWLILAGISAVRREVFPQATT